MSKTKAELQADCEAYRDIAEKSRNAHEQGQFLDALTFAVSALQYVDGMMQFERRFEDTAERETVGCIEYVLQHAPLFFDSESLDTVANLLKSQKRVEKNTSTKLSDGLESAIALMWKAHRLWTYLESVSAVAEDNFRTQLGDDLDQCFQIVERWETLGLVKRFARNDSSHISLTTRLDATTRGKCPSCGVSGKAPKEKLLEKIRCPKCHAETYFVILSSGD